ncbi:uncharacterized protein N7458_005916 [Penicillium daleae]|uniref:Xylanolytic transcriptional activator regulatory domain-containing protein n=1 Tax=Penicillium daleae TaxID=63821 RepID=A0AAD6C4H6_9EURO|nr:uncharacterized protein N7458_005916 [Penicillium daleae]KAJ5449467.1 hypothetical protein N7458_005916 [Penicillium daleae]
MLQLMEPPTGNSSDNAITGEIRIRVWWALFMADNWCSSSLGLPRQMRDFPRPAHLPMDEQLFSTLTPDQPLSVWQSCEIPGLWAHMVTLVELFAPIQELNWRVAHGESLQQGQIDHNTEQLAQQLDTWLEKLPRGAQPTEFNLAEHTKRGTGGPFLALHLGFHHYCTLLYYQYLDTQLTPTIQTQRFAARCKLHAFNYSTLLAHGRQQAGCEAVYPTVGHMTVVSSSVLLHTILFGTEDELPQSHHWLRTNFEALLELEQYWPTVKSMVVLSRV